MAYFNTECIVLKNINYKDTDKLYTLLSRDKGKIFASGRGVRRLTSKKRGNLDTLNQVKAKFYVNTKGYKYISEVQTLRSFLPVKSNLETSSAGLYMAYLVDNFLEDDQDSPAVYNLFLNTLRLLESEKIPSSVLVNYFELSLASLSGYEISFNRCNSCNKPADVHWDSYHIDIDRGGLICSSCLGDKQLNTPMYGLKAHLSYDEVSVFDQLASGRLKTLPSNYGSKIDSVLKSYIRGLIGKDFTHLGVF